jgi:ABC-2 type transport system permease protein
MISFSAIWAVTLRHTRMWRREYNHLIGLFYWPLLDIFTWGFLGSWIQQAAQFNNYEAIAILSLLLWQVVGRGSNAIGFAFAEELWSNNVVNLFSLPLSIVEWILGVLLFGAMTITLTFLFGLFFISLLYNVSLWYIVSTFLIFFPPLFFSAIWFGFTCLQIIAMLGKRGVELGFVACWFFMPFSGAFYPIEVLPQWAQTVSAWLPMSYVFQGMRGYLMHQQDPTAYLIKGYAMSILYATIAILLFIYCFNRSKQKGLARLAD